MNKDVKRKFKVNDKVFYPAHGAGIVKDIKMIDFAGEEKLYYEFKFINNELTISTPVENIDRLRVRTLNKTKDVEKAMKEIKKIPTIQPPSENYNEIMNILKTNDLSGDINSFVLMIQYCNHIKKSRGEDGRLIPSSIVKNARNAIFYLVGELTLSKNISYEKSIEQFEKLAEMPIDFK